jgi:hypothetical protein
VYWNIFAIELSFTIVLVTHLDPYLYTDPHIICTHGIAA